MSISNRNCPQLNVANADKFPINTALHFQEAALIERIRRLFEAYNTNENKC